MKEENIPFEELKESLMTKTSNSDSHVKQKGKVENLSSIPQNRRNYLGIVRYIIGYFIYIIIFIPITLGVIMIEEIDTHNAFYRDIFKRK